jgi:NAD(P)-dependent dehydrogenase (short-subunit alcohol dehydrogenase family)
MMTTKPILISTGNLTPTSLADQVAIVTGAGGGIGFETARALAWLGAKVVIAEIDKKRGKAAAERINAEMGAGKAGYIPVDVGDEGSVQNLARQVIRNLKKVDIVINNATVAPVGAVVKTPILDWDVSYRVNLRGPALLARAFLPGMIERKYGVFVCVSSVGDAYMSAYETMKTAQVHLGRILDIELEGSGVIAFTIGPGLVMTQTAQTQIKKLAQLYGKTEEEFYEMSREHIISVEEAGAGFAAAVAYAERFKGNEIDARMALNAAGIEYGAAPAPASEVALSAEQAARALELCREVRSILEDQVQGWAKRPLFERQWVVRDFKKFAGMPAEQCLDTLAKLESRIEAGDVSDLPGREIPGKLAQYFVHYQELSQGFFKDKQKLEETLNTLRGWQEKAEELAGLLA